MMFLLRPRLFMQHIFLSEKLRVQRWLFNSMKISPWDFWNASSIKRLSMGITFKMIKRDDQNVFRVELRVFRFTHYKSAWEIFFHSREFLEVNCEQRWSVFLLWENIVLTLIEVPVFLKIEWLMKMFCSLNILGWSIASYRHNISDMEQNFIVKERELIIWFDRQ